MHYAHGVREVQTSEHLFNRWGRVLEKNLVLTTVFLTDPQTIKRFREFTVRTSAMIH